MKIPYIQHRTVNLCKILTWTNKTPPAAEIEKEDSYWQLHCPLRMTINYHVGLVPHIHYAMGQVRDDWEKFIGNPTR